MKERCHFEILKGGFFEAQLLSDAHAPFCKARAVNAGVEILQVEKLIERADDGAAEGGSLLFKLLDAEGLRRQKKRGASRRRRNLTLEHQGFVLVNAVPKQGGRLCGRQILEVLTDEDLLKERSRCALNEIEAVAVLS
jgi:hypothetical protein